jgi:hypothetical protein
MCNHLYVEQRGTENVDSKGWPTGPGQLHSDSLQAYMPKIALGTIPKKAINSESPLGLNYLMRRSTVRIARVAIAMAPIDMR